MEIDYEVGDNGFTKISDQLLEKIDSLIQNIEIDHSPHTLVKISKFIGQFEVSPDLLDSKLTDYVTQLSNKFLEYQEKQDHSITNAISNIVYNLSKIRGFKVIANFFDSDIDLISKVIRILRKERNEDEIFMCLIWMCTLVLIPFPFADDMIQEILELGLKNLGKFSNGSKNQQVSLIMVSRFLSRQDMKVIETQYFKGLDWYEIPENEKLGHLMVINKLLKIKNMDEHIDGISDFIKFDMVDMRTRKMNTLNILLMIKILGKIGEKHVIDDKFKALENILNNLVNDFMMYLNESFETPLRYALAKSLSRITTKLSNIPNYQEQNILYLLSKIDIKLSTFKEIEIDADTISIPKYHTILLYIGYVSLNKSLPTSLVPTVLSIVHKTLFVQQNINATNQLKDTSCFIIWSILRMVGKKFEELNENLMFNIILNDLIEVSVFDKDLIIRRCAVAVIQEFIGRYGREAFRGSPEFIGKKIIELMDIFTSSTVSTSEVSFDNLDELLDKGYNKGLIVSMLLRNLDEDFKYQKLVSKKLNELLKLESTDELNIGIEETVPTINEIANKFDGLEHSLYLKSELSLNFGIDFRTKEYKEDLIIDYIKFLEVCCQNGVFGSYESLLTQIIQSRKDIHQELIGLFKVMRKNYQFPHSSFKTLSHFFSLSVAKSIFYLKLTSEQVHALVEVINSDINYEIRYNLIDCLRINVDRFSIDYSQLSNALNDYTITEQGDVGSRVRGSLLQFIDENPQHFNCTPDLIRICGEPISKLRYQAFNIIIKMKKLDIKLEESNDEQYYKHLFSIYDSLEEEEITQFWKGIVLSIGGLTGDKSNLTHSFREFLKFFYNQDQKMILKEIFKLLTKKKNELSKILKEYNQGLNLIIKLFEVSTVFPKEYLKPLFVKCYNLQVNTSNLQRIKLSLKVMQYLTLCEDKEVNKLSIERIQNLLINHKSPIIKTNCMEILYELMLEDPISLQIETLDIEDITKINSINQYILNKLLHNES